MKKYLHQRWNKEKYREYLRSDWWKKKKKNTGNKICFVCSTKNNLQLHHLTYVRIGREKDKDLKWLCREHHEGFHKFTNKKNKKALKNYKRFILTGIVPEMRNSRRFHAITQEQETESIKRRMEIKILKAKS